MPGQIPSQTLSWLFFCQKVWMHFSWVLLSLILSTFSHCRVRWTQTLEYLYPWLWVLLLIAESNQLKPLITVYSAILLRITHYSYSVWMHWFTQFFLVKVTQLFLLCVTFPWPWRIFSRTIFLTCGNLCISYNHRPSLSSRWISSSLTSKLFLKIRYLGSVFMAPLYAI